MNDLKNALFGSLLPSEVDNVDYVENINIRDMPPLKTEEETVKRQKAQGLKIMTSKK